MKKYRLSFRLKRYFNIAYVYFIYKDYTRLPVS